MDATYTRVITVHNVDAKSHYHPYAAFVILTHTTHIISSTALTYTPHCHPRFVDIPRRSDCTDIQMDVEAGWWTASGKIGLHPLARVKEWVDNNVFATIQVSEQCIRARTADK